MRDELTAMLDRAKAKTGSDGNTARLLGVGDQAISNWRTGRAAPNNTLCAKLAQVIERQPIEVIAAAETRRAKNAEEKREWTRILKKAAAAAVLLAVTAPTPNAQAQFNNSQINAPAIHIIALSFGAPC